MKFEHIMIDIETKGTKSNSVITHIAAVCFDIKTGKKGASFCRAITENSCIAAGLMIDEATVYWWEQQPKEVKEALRNVRTTDLFRALADLWFFIKQNTIEDVKVWGNSARFDLGLIENAADKVGVNIAWKYYNERDVRTLVAFKPKIKAKMKFKGKKHHPLHDCHHQIAYCSKIWRKLKYNWLERLIIDFIDGLKIGL